MKLMLRLNCDSLFFFLFELTQQGIVWEGFHVGTTMDIDPHHLCFARITHTHKNTYT